MKWKQTKTITALLVIPFLLIFCSGPEDYVENCADTTFSRILQVRIDSIEQDLIPYQNYMKTLNEVQRELEDPNFSIEKIEKEECDSESSEFQSGCFTLPDLSCAEDEIRDTRLSACLPSTPKEYAREKKSAFELFKVINETSIKDLESEISNLVSIREFVTKNKLKNKLLNRNDDLKTTDYEAVFEACSKQYGEDKITFESKWQ